MATILEYLIDVWHHSILQWRKRNDSETKLGRLVPTLYYLINASRLYMHGDVKSNMMVGKCWSQNLRNVKNNSLFRPNLRTVLTFVSAHTFCASRKAWFILSATLALRLILGSLRNHDAEDVELIRLINEYIFSTNLAIPQSHLLCLSLSKLSQN